MLRMANTCENMSGLHKVGAPMARRMDAVRWARGLASLPCFLLIISSTLASAEERTGVHPVNWQKPYSAANYDFLGALSDGKSVIQLGESIHMTDEFPRVRLQFIRYLHEQKGFDVLAFEGSWVQAWL